MSDMKLIEEYVEKMEKCEDTEDTEISHMNADDLLCELLTKLGYHEVVFKFEEVRKGYG